MNRTALVAWLILLLGILPSVLLGRWLGGVAKLLGASLLLGFVVFFIMNVALAACVEAKYCPALGDVGITYALYPLAAIPFYWLIACAIAKAKE